jgi:hypothetical protein
MDERRRQIGGCLRLLTRTLVGLVLLALPAAAICSRSHAPSQRRAPRARARDPQAGRISDPKVAASRLYDAWRAGRRPAALRVATSEAVGKLFGVRRRAMRFEGCHNKEEGGFQCVYRDARLDLSLAMEVDGGASAGYSVTSVSFSSEE